MNPSEQHDQDDLERRLRDAFAAKALQVSDADLDRDREDEFAAALSSRRRTSPVTRLFAGIGAAAAAAAIVGVTVVGLHDDGKHEVVDGLPPAVTTTSSGTTASTTTSPTARTGNSKTPAVNKPATPGGDLNTKLPSSGPGTAVSSAPKSATSAAGGDEPSARSGPSTAENNSTSSRLSATADQPPAISSSLPQAGTLGDEEYTGAVPLKDPSGGTARMLAMPSDLTWQRTAETGNSLTVRITYLPTDVEAYWQQTLPGEGWVKNGSGWSYPGTSYTVSAISDKGSFTVTW
jgi:hypothetical protein